MAKGSKDKMTGKKVEVVHLVPLIEKYHTQIQIGVHYNSLREKTLQMKLITIVNNLKPSVLSPPIRNTLMILMNSMIIKE